MRGEGRSRTTVGEGEAFPVLARPQGWLYTRAWWTKSFSA
jgi:hypothetical protein